MVNSALGLPMNIYKPDWANAFQCNIWVKWFCSAWVINAYFVSLVVLRMSVNMWRSNTPEINFNKTEWWSTRELFKTTQELNNVSNCYIMVMIAQLQVCHQVNVKIAKYRSDHKRVFNEVLKISDPTTAESSIQVLKYS